MRFLLAILLCLGSARVLAIDINGQTEFAQRLALNSSISGRVKVINVAVGQQVAAGEVLLSLVTTGLQANAAIAAARVNSLAPALDRMLAEMEKAQELFDRDSLALVDLFLSNPDLPAISEADKFAINEILVSIITDELGHQRHVAIVLPNFVPAVRVVSSSNLLLTVPRLFATDILDTTPELKIYSLPFETRTFDYSMIWHDRYQFDLGHQWLRGIIRNAFVNEMG